MPNGAKLEEKYILINKVFKNSEDQVHSPFLHSWTYIDLLKSDTGIFQKNNLNL